MAVNKMQISKYRSFLQANSNTNSTNTWKLNNALMNHKRVKEKIKGKIKDFLKFNENDHTTYPN